VAAAVTISKPNPNEGRKELLASILSSQERSASWRVGRNKTISLIRYNAARGMSRRRIDEIWGPDLARVALDEPQQ
jgi:hypothetical protein